MVFGEVGNANVEALEDINGREAVMLSSLAFMVLLVGLWPAPLVDMMHVSVNQLLEQIAVSKIN